jgi:hypothetical protein
VVGVWPRPRSMRRALRCDGIIPQYQLGDRAATPDDARAVRAWLTDQGAGPGLDMVAEGETPADDPAAATARVAPGRPLAAPGGWRPAGRCPTTVLSAPARSGTGWPPALRWPAHEGNPSQPARHARSGNCALRPGAGGHEPGRQE